MDYLKVIKLGYGKGKPGESACWMTALQAHMNGEWTDTIDCVEPVINKLCIKINDSYGIHNKERTEDILEFGLFEPLGTIGNINTNFNRKSQKTRDEREIWIPYIKQNTLGYEYLASLGYVAPNIYIILQKMHRSDFPIEIARQIIKKCMFPTLRKIIDMGPCGPKEKEIRCSVEEFHQKIGV